MKCLKFSGCSSESKRDQGRRPPWNLSSSLGSGSNPDGRRSGSERNSNTDVSGGSPGSSLLLSSSMRQKELRVFSFSELKAATRNFNRTNLLGEGGFGCVYKGSIKLKRADSKESRMEVAVKQLNSKGLQGHKEWLSEIKYLGLVDDPNLVKLVGYCLEDAERGVQMLLVYEYMPRGSLEVHLFRRSHPVLPWELRVRIALGAARGLAYLHEELEFQIIYRDFKTSNILLDSDFSPKLSDFGLARLGPEGNDSHVSTAVVGTVGYAAPEYVHTGHLTSKSDVWSFGVVLLELLTGRKALDRNRPRNEQRLVDWVKPYIATNRKFHLMMDPRLEGQYPLQAAQKMATLASSCLHKYPKARPKMSELVEGLKQVLELSMASDVATSSTTSAAALSGSDVVTVSTSSTLAPAPNASAKSPAAAVSKGSASAPDSAASARNPSSASVPGAESSKACDKGFLQPKAKSSLWRKISMQRRLLVKSQ